MNIYSIQDCPYQVSAIDYLYEKFGHLIISRAEFEKVVLLAVPEKLPQYFICFENGLPKGEILLLAERNKEAPEPFHFRAISNADEQDVENAKQMLEFAVQKCTELNAIELRKDFERNWDSTIQHANQRSYLLNGKTEL